MWSDLEITIAFAEPSDFSIAGARPRKVCSRLSPPTAAGPRAAPVVPDDELRVGRSMPAGGGGVEFVVARAEPSVELARGTGGGEINRGSATGSVSERGETSSTDSRGECCTSVCSDDKLSFVKHSISLPYRSRVWMLPFQTWRYSSCCSSGNADHRRV